MASFHKLSGIRNFSAEFRFWVRIPIFSIWNPNPQRIKSAIESGIRIRRFFGRIAIPVIYLVFQQTVSNFNKKSYITFFSTISLSILILFCSAAKEPTEPPFSFDLDSFFDSSSLSWDFSFLRRSLLRSRLRRRSLLRSRLLCFLLRRSSLFSS